MRFLTVSIDLIGASSQIDIIRAIGRGLREVFTTRNALQESVKGVWEFLRNWEVLGVRYHREGAH
jgi:hypothetical protein